MTARATLLQSDQSVFEKTQFECCQLGRFRSYQKMPGILETSTLESGAFQIPDMGSEEDTRLEVAIIGGGIVGLVLANGLVHQNVKVKVYEQAQSFREIGAGMAFTANATRCMELINPAVLEAFRSSGSVATSNGDAKDLNDYLRWIDGYNQRRDNDPFYQHMLFRINAGYRGFEGCRRDQFLEALVKIIPPSVIECRKRLDKVEDKSLEEKIQLTFVDGTSVEVDAGELFLRDKSSSMAGTWLICQSDWMRWHQVANKGNSFRKG